MKCIKCHELIPLYLLGELSGEEHEKVESHLNECPDCYQELKDIQHTVDMLQPVDTDNLAELEKLRLENRLYREMINRQYKKTYIDFRSIFVSYLPRVAAVIFVFFLGYFVHSVTEATPDDFPVKRTSRAYALSDYQSQSVSGFRLTPAGLKVIAKGKSALKMP